MSKIVKPMSIERAEFISELARLIRESRLPPFVIEPILRDALSDIKILSGRQLEIETKQYKEMLKNLKDQESKVGVDANEQKD